MRILLFISVLNSKLIYLDAGFSPVVYYRFAALLDRAVHRV
jgi:hypothetical protein